MSRLGVQATVFVTGAVTLALELIASRLLTPYVGGGVVVWTAILSVTLLALAAGYHLGSVWSARGAPARRFARLPALAALAIALTAALAPALLPGLAVGGALTGAFVGVIVVLAPALVLLSAMGPLAIALTTTARGDSGAGEVFAVSTVGSVAGVLAAAFLLLPFMAPTATLVALAAALLLAAAAAGRAVGALDRGLAALLAAGALAAIGAGASLASVPERATFGALTLTRVATERSAHGAAIVVDATHRSRPGAARLYLEENQPQSGVRLEDGGHALAYASVAQAAIEALAPPGGRVLVLGLAGGTIAAGLARAGYAVEAVDVNPHAEAVARRWFALPDGVVATVADARLRLAACGAPVEAILFDVYSGIEIPEHLVTREAFALAAACLVDGGVLVVNAVAPPLATRPTRRLLAAIAHGVGADLAVFDEAPNDPARRNRIVVATRRGPAAPALEIADHPRGLFERGPARLEPTLVTRAALADAAPLADASNDFALGLALVSPAPSAFPLPAGWR